MAGKRLIKYVPDYVVFDLETTGISPLRDAVVEISAVKVKDGKVIDTFSTLVNPQRKIPSAATAVNHITDQMVADAPVMAEALAQFLAFTGDAVLVGHNIHSFDMKFIERDVQEYFHRTITNDYIDTLQMARKCLPQLAHHRLVDISTYFHISIEGAHRALNDCMMNQKCFEQLGRLQGAQQTEVMICPKCQGELVKRKGRFGLFLGCSNYPNCRYTENI